MGYTPLSPSGLNDLDGVRSWVEGELLAIAQADTDKTQIPLQPIYVAPDKPRDGMIVYADGTHFNPTGEGAGTYEYSGGAWRKFNQIPVTYNVFTRTVNGLVPFPGGSGTTRFLREDSTFAVPPFPSAANTTTAGILETATDTEALAETSTAVAITPSNLHPVFLSEFAAGLGKGRFHVYRGGLAAGLTASTYNVIPYDVEALDAAGWFNTTTNLYFPLESGWYFIYVNVAIAPFVTAETAQALIYKNGGQVAAGFYATNVGTWSGGMSVSSLVFANGTSDYIQGVVFLPAGVTSIPGGAVTTYMGGWKVGT